MKTSNILLVLAIGCSMLAGCAGTIIAEPVKIPIPPRPTISLNYQALLIQAGAETAREALKHEISWLGYADKMEMRVK